MNEEEEEHELIRIKISDVKLDKTNPNQMSKDQMTGLRQSMERWGYLTPIILDQDNNICDGEHRLLVYKQLGRTEIPAYRLHLESDAERRMIRQVMNKLHGIHDKQLDADELATLFENNKLDDLSRLIAQQKEDLERLILRYHPDLDFRHPEDPAELDTLIDDEMKKISPDTQLGDIYQLGRHRLICADNSDKRSIDRLLEGAKIAQLNTDPPFGIRLGERNAELNKRFKTDGSRNSIQYENDDDDTDYTQMFNTIFRNLADSFTEYNTVYVFSGGKHLLHIYQAFEESQIHHSVILVWDKRDHVLSRTDYAFRTEFILYGWKGKHKFYGGFRTNVLSYDRIVKHEYHPAMRPTELVEQLVTDGTQQGDNVLDVFAGSGSVLMACERQNRNFYGVELDPHFCDVIVKRWEAYTGKKAVKL